MKTKVCIRCKKELTLDSFTRGHNKKDKAVEYVRNVCFRCQYGWNDFWELATEGEKVERMKELFGARVIKKDDCWDFEGITNSAGYFYIKTGGRFNPKSIAAHRVSWMIHNGEIPEGMCVLHTCDNRRCTNPEHLFLGTNADNVSDREQKGRGNQRRGEDHNKAVLTVIEVRKIKRLLMLGVPATKIARDFEVGNSTIYNIKYGNTWKDVASK